MGGFSIWHWIIVLAVVLILFGGGGKISRLMGDLGRGIKSFKAGIKDEDKDKDATDLTVTRTSLDPAPTEITGTATRTDLHGVGRTGAPAAGHRDEPVRG